MSITAQKGLYIVRRLVIGIPMVFAIVVINFFLLHLAPGDAAEVLAGEAGSATPQYLAQLRAQFGLDQPLYVQLFKYLEHVLKLDFGYSARYGMSVWDLILSRLGPSLLLMGTAITLAITVGILLGLIAAMRPNSVRDNAISILALLSYATPLFWVGLMFILVFSITLGWLPTSGMEDVAAFYTGWAHTVDVAKHLVLPAVTLSLFYLALYVRLMRSAVLEQTGMDYVTTARAVGASDRRVMFKHILRNACLPVVTMAGVQIGNLIGGSVVVESVFGWPGLGLLAFQGLSARDINLLLGIFFISACLVIATNIIVDVIYSILDPRIGAR
ncbi:MAG: ABC transporter permease [Paralcaligenes sp.]